MNFRPSILNNRNFKRMINGELECDIRVNLFLVHIIKSKSTYNFVTPPTVSSQDLKTNANTPGLTVGGVTEKVGEGEGRAPAAYRRGAVDPGYDHPSQPPNPASEGETDAGRRRSRVRVQGPRPSRDRHSTAGLAGRR